MASGYSTGAPADRYLGAPPPGTDVGHPDDRNWQQSGHHMPDRAMASPALSPNPNANNPGTPGRGWDMDDRQLADRNNAPRQKSSRSASGQVRICEKCGLQLTGQFVRALDGTYHLDCFKCRDCGQIVASKFFPVDDENGNGQYPLCETDYFRRLGLLCYQCGQALRASYITALDRKYHVNHFTCSVCPTVFGASDSYYEHDGQVYCHYHYSTRFAQRCNGCQTAILKQFVEIFRNGQNQHWHPECYMIHKFWNVRLSESTQPPKQTMAPDENMGRDTVKEEEERMEEKVYRIWSVLSAFEESSAACISDMLLHVSNGGFLDGVLVAKRFISHVEVLFRSMDRLNANMSIINIKPMSFGREAKLLCKKIVAFFSLLSKSQDVESKKLGVTQELLSLVTGLAHYLKLLIRICLQGALRLEQETHSPDGLYQFLDDLSDLESLRLEDTSLQVLNGSSKLSAKDSDHCALCSKSVEDECARNGSLRWHIGCVGCTRCGKDLGRRLQEARFNAFDKMTYCSNCIAIATEEIPPFEHITKLQQYVFLLKVALARLLDMLRSAGVIPPATEDPAANGHGVEGYGSPSEQPGAAQRSPLEQRSKTYPGAGEKDSNRESTYENTLADVRRLRSTRLDKHLSSSFRKARTSRIMDGPEGRSVRPGSAGGDDQNRADQQFHIVEDRGANDAGTTDTMFGNNDALTLDDIPRIVAAEQVREKAKPTQQGLFRSPSAAAGKQGSHQRSLSAGRDESRAMAEALPQRGGRRFFSELSGLEYFIIRHLAVLTMQPMLGDEFPLEELLSFIESRKPATFWKNLSKAFKNDKKAVKKKGVFGVPLELIIERDGADSTDGVGPGALRIPAVLDDLISSMRKMDLSVEGVFRKNGNIKKLGELCDTIDRDGSDTVNFMEQPVVQVAALLKRYLRELPDPLMTYKLYRLWIAAAKIPDDDKRRQCLHLACCLLPKCHRDALEILFCFLKWAGSFHQVDDESGSKMDIKNLATVIAPNILFANDKAPALDSDHMFAIVAVETLINYLEEMCLVPDELASLASDPYLFGGNGEITTKEILKRFQELQGQRPTQPAAEVYNRQDMSTRPPPRRVDTDPSLWQQESSARPMQDSGFAYPNSGPATPSAGVWRGREEPSHMSPYGQKLDHSDPQLAPPDHDTNQSREWRNSGWGRQGSGVAMGN
ncbi:hypothetical protein jhhlp_002342 [Lomentospora prolificans]|uniref:Uncharacterized protein n=1 Tax=Lomentospora prolificans TaxID=41688 RepID=A0A2N3NDT9_9PEZI|nr:hypothetical protein jhhlp_002342 [Lomentospora prolificans]